MRRHAWTVGVYGLLLAFLIFTVAIHPSFGAYDVQSLALGALPLALAAAAQTVVVISGGIDLSIGPMMAVANVLAARAMLHQNFRDALLIAALVLIGGAAAGAFNGLVVVFSRVPDIVVTLAMSFVWGGIALLILEKPGGGAPQEFQDLAGGTIFGLVPNALVVLIVTVAVVWLPLRWGRLGLSLYAIGSDRTAALGSGVNISSTRLLAYTLSGVFSGAGGLALTMTTGIGSPLSGTFYTLSGVATIVLGGVSLAGGKGGMLGPLAAALVLTLIPTELIFLGIDPNYGQVIQGVVIVLVVMTGGLAALRRKAA